MLVSDFVATSGRVAALSRRVEKIAALAAILRRLSPAEVQIGVDWLAGRLRQGRLGLGPGVVAEARRASPSVAQPALTLGDADAVFTEIARASGPGAAGARRAALGGLFARATDRERDFFARLLAGELRQERIEPVMIDAVARAARVPPTSLRRAVMLAGDAAEVAKAALLEGALGLQRFSLQLLRPVQPMLAQSADDVATALSELRAMALEWKLDGVRVQAHKAGDEVRVFSRGLGPVTKAVPEIVEIVRALPVRSVVLDGEALTFRAEGPPHPFQVTMRRFGRAHDAAALRAELPLRALFFDVLHLDGEDLLDRPGSERTAALRQVLDRSLRVPRIELPTAAEAEAFFADALARGHEGVIAKSLAAPYEAGRRRGSWLKVKRARTLDLVVLAAEWGTGRRRGLLSNLHLGARDPSAGGFVLLGKTFKGMSDEVLAWQTQRLLELEIGRDAGTVYVRPEIVVEVAFEDVQASPRYPGGVVLRSARVRRYRPDKAVEGVSTMVEVRAIHAGALAREAAEKGQAEGGGEELEEDG
ncbi:ATP-dependent DNA ligase [Sorangium atrum]|uniref:Probable DNA ligase n=1 Tax=Sorangium atrum TaxID=2995308 RepID=A0ABT5CHL3_9BACT|nr:ATP-dependent DNA ligase [Sorangium aterium]MDC0685931.1 ATP-dependent DNA ligase [Sorangium aterium]